MDKRTAEGLRNIVSKYCGSRIKTVQGINLDTLGLNKRSMLMLMALRGKCDIESALASCIDMRLERDITTSSGSMYEEIVAFLADGERITTREDKTKYPGIDVRFYKKAYDKTFLGQIKSGELAFNSGTYYDATKKLDKTSIDLAGSRIFIGIADGSRENANAFLKKLGNEFTILYDDELYRFASDNKVTGQDVTDVILETSYNFTLDEVSLSDAIDIKIGQLKDAYDSRGQDDFMKILKKK